MQVHNLTASLGGKTILHGLDFTARAGDVTAIVGPNGSGKSTFLKAMTGEIAASGTLTLNGSDLSGLAAWQLASWRAVQSQSITVAFPFTVEEIVSLGHKAGLAASDPTVPAQALDRVGLSGYGPRPYHGLSGGEQQRVHLARALTQVWPVPDQTQPRWLFLDEPVSSLDIGHQLLVVDVLRAFARSGGGVICVMHDLNLTTILADRMVLLRDGRITAQGSPQEVMQSDRMSHAYGHPLVVSQGPTGLPMLLPQQQVTRVAP